ncbi:hypothetical protein BGZ61DRAFT_446922 [Ilyonectria robusta]|uniref:uncharacterized protein n=1 Tax=Ilyonectria robusta TaxID=1079257 RepID=UPI001E8D3370|nr:uncharacterized protein BGZ61DRAFT_446922 [Ilyonectria robusta]KAH8729739.1 hypothetical protein BGZ61DRAFT_446922 [Ilyonectria robusta]
MHNADCHNEMWSRMPSRTRMFNAFCTSHHCLALSMNTLDLVSRNRGSCGWRPLFHGPLNMNHSSVALLASPRLDNLALHIKTSLDPRRPSVLTPKSLPWPLSNTIQGPVEWPMDARSNSEVQMGRKSLLDRALCSSCLTSPVDVGIGETPGRGRGGFLSEFRPRD